MKNMISRVFSKKGEPSQMPPANPVVSSELSHSDIENYYLRIIIDCLRRMLVPIDSIEVGIKRSGTGPGGVPAFAGYVRITKWDPVVTPVLLQNMPVIDARIRKVAEASVILEHTHFTGLWFQATSSTEGSPKTLLGLPSQLIHLPGAIG
ncbi:hypothetical protein [Caenimonas soli]|uniref:hypothetical protein n=1 Tax=Caenimonas soli TaxID=2735555 RepID=UPI0015561B6D|nr:hypothetical protein [Caenimonas soli]NPC57633.1 hypothetical protein [Caenimonas soli]